MIQINHLLINGLSINMNKEKIRVMLLDDHPAIRHGISMAIDLEDDMMVAAECSNVADAVKIILNGSIDVVLVDISLEGGADGFDFIKAAKERFSSVKSLVLSMYDETLYAERAILTGAMGYITKKEPVQEIINGIREVMKGNLFIPGDISGKLIMKLMKMGVDENTDSHKGLTPREREILRLIGAGNSPAEIARELKLSVNTVETHRRHLKEKLGLNTSRDLFKYAIKASES